MKSLTSLASLAIGLGCSALLCSCTNPTSTAGSTSTFIDGTIENIEIIDLDSNKYDSGTNTLLAGLGGAVIGQLIGGNTTGTLVGAGVGAVAGGLGSNAANRSDGLRLTLDTINGAMVADMPYSCSYKVGQKVRFLSSSSGNGAQIQIFKNGRYVTVKEESKSACPTRYDNMKASTVSAD